MNPDKPSATAILIAKSIVFVDGDARYHALMPQGMVELSQAFLQAATSRVTMKTYEILGKMPAARWAVRLLESLSVPGMIGHYIVRKRRLEEFVDATAARLGGLDQLVIMGAGLDTLGTRMARRRPSMRVYELDHPATSKVKRRAFDSQVVSLPPNLTLIPVDLGTVDARTELEAAPQFDFSRRTLFVAEGVFMYLSMDAVGCVLDLLKEFPEKRAAFVFTYMLPSPVDGRPAFTGQNRWVDKWLGRKREPFVWGATPDALDTFVRGRALTPLDHADQPSMRADYLSSKDLQTLVTATGENIAWIES